MILESLNEAQKQAVLHNNSPLLILAGAGSGKTRVITHKIAWLISQGVYPSKILAVTFTNKAAGEMKERISALVPSIDIHNAWVGTFHSIALRILRRYPEKAGLKPNFIIYDRDDQLALIKDLAKEEGASMTRSEVAQTLNIISRAKQDGLTCADESEDPFLTVISQRYEQRLLEANAVDFDNILCFTVSILSANKEIKEYYNNYFNYILVDEYQDTNRIQFDFIRILGEGKKGICAVGDEDQSIYSWRGASIENIFRFEETFPETQIIKLEQNYRSTPVILKAANCVIRNNSYRKDKALWTEQSGGEKIRVIKAGDRENEGLTVAMEILRLREKGHPLSEMAVFVRTNAFTREIEKGLRGMKLPYKIIGALRFFDRKEVRDILAYLKVINNEKDLVSLARIINTPKRGIGKQSLDTLLLKITRDKTSLSALCKDPDLSPRILRALKPFAALIASTRKVFDEEGLGKGLEFLLQELGYQEYLTAEFEDARDRWDNVVELMNDMYEYENASTSPDLAHYLSEVTLIQDIDFMGRDVSDTVSVMTLHKAKGLEFDTVFIAGLEENILPHANSLGSFPELEEERRLFYVGITRARRRVFLTWAQSPYLFNRGPAAFFSQEGGFSKPSRFLDEIPDEFKEMEPVKKKFLFRDGPGAQRPSGDRIRLKTGMKIYHEEFGEGFVLASKMRLYVIDFSGELKEVDPLSEKVRIIE